MSQQNPRAKKNKTFKIIQIFKIGDEISNFDKFLLSHSRAHDWKTRTFFFRKNFVNARGTFRIGTTTKRTHK